VGDLGSELLTADELAELLKIPRGSVYRLNIPRFHAGRRVRWRRVDVDSVAGGRCGRWAPRCLRAWKSRLDAEEAEALLQTAGNEIARILCPTRPSGHRQYPQTG
jgi:hypothetical protein